MICVVCGKPNPRGNRWQVCSAKCEMVRAKTYVPGKRQGHCALCGKIFTKPWPKSKYCSAECACKVRNKRRTAEIREDMHNLTAFRKRLTDSHYELAKDDPNPTARQARVRYLATEYERKERILMEFTGKPRCVAAAMPCKKADEILARVG